MRLQLRLRTQGIQRVDGGIPVGAHENIIVTVDRSELAPPRAEVEHLRFLHHPHVLQGHRLCLYLDPSREWDPRNGFGGFLDRLFNWLADAAGARSTPRPRSTTRSVESFTQPTKPPPSSPASRFTRAGVPTTDGCRRAPFTGLT